MVSVFIPASNGTNQTKTYKDWTNHTSRLFWQTNSVFFFFFSLTVRNLTTEQKHLSRAHTTWVSGWLNPNLSLHTIRGEIWGKSLAGPRLSDIVSLQRCSSHIRATLMTLNMFDIYKLRLLKLPAPPRWGPKWFMTGPCLDLEEPVTGMSSPALTQWTWGRIVMPCVKTSGNGLSIHHKEQWWWRLKHSFSIKSAVTCEKVWIPHRVYSMTIRLPYHEVINIMLQLFFNSTAWKWKQHGHKLMR